MTDSQHHLSTALRLSLALGALEKARKHLEHATANGVDSILDHLDDVISDVAGIAEKMDEQRETETLRAPMHPITRQIVGAGLFGLKEE